MADTSEAPITFEHLVGTQTCRIHALRLELAALEAGTDPPALSYEQIIGAQTCELYDLERQRAAARARRDESPAPAKRARSTGNKG